MTDRNLNYDTSSIKEISKLINSMGKIISLTLDNST